MKSTHPAPDPHDPKDSSHSPVKEILKRQGAELHIKGAKGTSHKSIAEELLAEMDVERTRTAVVQANLNAILNQYQVTQASVKQLQASHEDLQRRYQEKLNELKRLEAGNGADDTETQGA